METIVGGLYRQADPDRDGLVPGPQAPVIAAEALKKAEIESISQVCMHAHADMPSRPHKLTPCNVLPAGPN